MSRFTVLRRLRYRSSRRDSIGRGSARNERRHFPRPERFIAPVAGSVVLLLSWAAVAHASGSGWVQAIGAIAAGLVFVGMVGPVAAATRLEVTCVTCPRDATSGQPVELEFESNQPLRLTPKRPGGPAVVIPVGRPVTVTMTPPTRGVLYAVEVRLATAAPLGLLWWSVRRTVLLAGSLEVAPPASSVRASSAEGSSQDEGDGKAELSVTGDLRGVRAYNHGDSPRQVHWRATAHTGSLMIRETEQRPEKPVKVVAHLPADTALAEQMASKAAASVAALLAAGKRVILETDENGEVVLAPVSDLLRAGRRLARAGHNPYADIYEPTLATSLGLSVGVPPS